MNKIKLLRISTILIVSHLLHSCYTYNSTTIDRMEIGKPYRVKVTDGREITNKYLGTTNDSLTFKARNVQIHFPKSHIESVERKRNSPFTYVVGFAVPAFLIYSITTNKKDPIIQ